MPGQFLSLLSQRCQAMMQAKKTVRHPTTRLSLDREAPRSHTKATEKGKLGEARRPARPRNVWPPSLVPLSTLCTAAWINCAATSAGLIPAPAEGPYYPTASCAHPAAWFLIRSKQSIPAAATQGSTHRLLGLPGCPRRAAPLRWCARPQRRQRTATGVLEHRAVLRNGFHVCGAVGDRRRATPPEAASVEPALVGKGWDPGAMAGTGRNTALRAAANPGVQWEPLHGDPAVVGGRGASVEGRGVSIEPALPLTSSIITPAARRRGGTDASLEAA